MLSGNEVMMFILPFDMAAPVLNTKTARLVINLFVILLPP
jgi:hypothetical protein